MVKKKLSLLIKLKNAIAKAFLSVGSFATQDVITTVLSRVSVSDGMNVEEIQNQVEVALMAGTLLTVLPRRICCIVRNIWRIVR